MHCTPTRTSTRRTIGVLTSVATAAAMLVAASPASQAGPDDGKTVATEAHVDAPKTYWENGTFALKSEVRQHAIPLDGTVNWIGRGYSTLLRPEQKFMFTVPDDPVFAPLSDHGRRWYAGPHIAGDHNTPIWAGFGADDKIPTETFRDGSFSLDVVGFSGPGRMEAFNAWDHSLSRLLSSHDPSYRSSYLTPKNHTHNVTAFTKPGRYVVDYRTTARGKDGRLIASKTSTLVWQVGGTRPADKATTPLKDSFAAAPSGKPSTPYTFTMKPHTGREKPADDQLTDMVFDAGDKNVRGTVTFFIDGFHLAELPVVDGRATWSEMIGSGTSKFQAVFVPASGSSAPRWASSPLAYEFGPESASTTSATGEESLPTEHSQDPAPAFDLKEYSPASAVKWTVDVTPGKPDDDTDKPFVTRIKLSDPRYRANIDGGYYDKPDAKYSTCQVYGVTDEHGELKVSNDGDVCGGYYLKFKISPHALVKAPGGSVEVTVPLPKDSLTLHRSGELATGDATPKPTPTPTPKPDSVLTTPVLLERGHVDIKADLDHGTLRGLLGDDTLSHAKHSVDRSLGSVALAVPDSARKRRPSSGMLAEPRFGFLGRKGALVHMLPEVNDNVHVWPGWSTNALAGTGAGAATLRIAPAVIPAGGAYHVFSADSITGRLDHMVDSTSGKVDVAIPEPTHAHATWSFSKPGAYLLHVSWTTTLGGRTVSSRPECLTFLVGDAAIADHRAGRTPSCPAVPGASTSPSAPAVTPSTPVASPSTPAVTPSVPVATPSTPVVSPSAPAVSPTSPTTSAPAPRLAPIHI
ncbi:choice-of-anchor M domain-containing protein [Acidipropionibacterium timonense]|uniref:choice-of-anchor M domain-containing protein n=1 Tax=Acidipropionibacterium timonense TaxID=2161818 RepID=UPI0010302D61|nr:choice-of-anchor M domain-containing protein [Acidipropionibacterium timonense]